MGLTPKDKIKVYYSENKDIIEKYAEQIKKQVIAEEIVFSAQGGPASGWKIEKIMIKTEAIILKSADSNEVDRLLTIYSEKLGKINISAKGVKKLESKLRYSIEAISYVQMILVEGKNFLILKDAFIIDQFLNIKKDLEKIKIARKLAELIDEALVGEEQDEEIWKLILGTFKKINSGNMTSEEVPDFEKKLIGLLGYNPEHMKEIQNLY